MRPITCAPTGSGRPEDLVVELHDTGLKGGDAGHGGFTTLTFSTETGTHAAVIDYQDGTCSEVDLTDAKLTIVSRGDWEQQSVYGALKRLGQAVKKAEGFEKAGVSALPEYRNLRNQLESDLTKLLRAEVGEEKFKALTEIVNKRWNA